MRLPCNLNVLCTMKKVSLNRLNTKRLTEVIASISSKYTVTVRPAQGGSGDDVYNVYNPTTRTGVSYCVKVSQNGDRYVNWASVRGPEEYVDKFLVMVGYLETQAPTNSVSNPLL